MTKRNEGEGDFLIFKNRLIRILTLSLFLMTYLILRQSLIASLGGGGREKVKRERQIIKFVRDKEEDLESGSIN